MRKWKLRGLKLGKERARIIQNDNGYIQDTFLEFQCIKNDEDIQRENDIETRKTELEAKKAELQTKNNELNAKNGEIQPLFTGAIDDKAIKTMIEFLKDRESALKAHYTNYFTIPGGRLLTQHLGLGHIELGFFNKADTFVKYQNDMLNAIKATNSSVTNYKFNAHKRGMMMGFGSHEFNALKEWHWEMFARDHWTTGRYRAYRDGRSRVGWGRYKLHHRTDGGWYLNYGVPRLRNISEIFFKWDDLENFYQKLQQTSLLIDKIKDLEALVARLEREKQTKEQENHDILY